MKLKEAMKTIGSLVSGCGYSKDVDAYNVIRKALEEADELSHNTARDAIAFVEQVKGCSKRVAGSNKVLVALINQAAVIAQRHP